MRNKILISFIIIFLILLLSAASLLAQLAGAGKQDADLFAREIVQDKKLIPYPKAKDYANEKVYKLIIEGKKYWDQGDLANARIKFEAALSLVPYSEKIQGLIDIVRRAAIEKEKRYLSRQADLVDAARILDVDTAHILLAPEGIARTEEEKTTASLSELEKNARQIIHSVDFTDAEIRDVLEFLSKKTNINIVIDETVLGGVGKVTVHLKNVTLLDTLEIVLRTKGLNYRLDDNLIWISSAANMDKESLVTKIYNLSQGLAAFTTFTTFDTVTIANIRADNERVIGEKEKSKTEDSKKKDKEQKESYVTDSALRSAASGGVKTFEGIKIGGSSGVAGTVTMTIKDVLLQNVSWPQGSSIFLDNRTSKLIVRNTPTNIQLIDKIIEALDVNPPQVTIEARFVEVNADDLRQLGVEWNAAATLSAAGKATTFPFKRGDDGKYFPATPTEMPTGGFGYGVLDFSEFQAVLQAIEQNTKNNLLSAPKVTTVSGQEAIIKVAKEYRYPTRYDVQTLQSGTGTNATYVYVTVPADFKTRDIGIILKVMPNVGADGKTINLTLVPEVSEFDIDKDMYNYGTTDYPYKQPFFSVQNCTASIIVEEGQTVVMGGLMKENSSRTISKVPFLGDIPLIGKAFRYENDDKEKKNLLIFVTAHLLTPRGEKQAAKNL